MSARVMNEDTVYDREASWPTFPERLEDAGVSWRIYQNEISIDSGLSGDEDAWLSSFGDNPIEWFTQYNIRFAKSRRAYLPKFLAEAPGADPGEGARAAGDEPRRRTRARNCRRRSPRSARPSRTARPSARSTPMRRGTRCSARARALHQKAFTTNTGDPAYRSLTKLTYKDGDDRSARSACRAATSCTSSARTCRRARCPPSRGSSRRRTSPTIRARRGTARGTSPKCSTS